MCSRGVAKMTIIEEDSYFARHWSEIVMNFYKGLVARPLGRQRGRSGCSRLPRSEIGR